MRQTVEPDIEFDRWPVLWSAVTLVVLGLVCNFVIFRPNWLPWAAIVAGGVAATCSGFYQQSANSGAVGVLLGTLVLTPVLAHNRIAFWYGVDGTGDTVFLSLVLSLGWLLIVIMILVPLGYVGAFLADIMRKRVGGTVGY